MQTLLPQLRQLYPTHSDNKLYAAILAGEVSVNGQLERRPARRVKPDDRLNWNRDKPFVSRGGIKLAKAVDCWRLPVRSRVIIDAGASTGGFSDCLLRYGAAKIYAVDCGYNQLHHRLRQDHRIVNCQCVLIQDFCCRGLRPDWAVADLSFRPLRGVLRQLLNYTNQAWGVVLCKPQFEWQAPDGDFNGIVADRWHREILRQCRQNFLKEGVCIDAILPSPLPGRRGNLEYLLLVRVQGAARQYLGS